MINTLSSEQLQPKIRIPKVVHFIWAGGNKLMPSKSLAVVKAWAVAHPQFEVWLWIDKKTAPLNVELEKYYQSQLSAVKNLHCKDITEEEVSTPIIRYEIDRLDPNYGASSDLLRYRILCKFGGAYFDSDVMPGEQSLEELGLFDVTLEQHVCYVDHFSQIVKEINLDSLKEFTLKYITEPDSKSDDNPLIPTLLGNDAFICTKDNPLMLEIRKMAESNYQYQASDSSLLYLSAYASHNIKDLTIERTGPTIIRKCLSQLSLIKSNIQENKEKREFTLLIEACWVVIRPLRCDKYQCVKPLKNKKNWLDVGLEFMLEPENIELVFNKILRAIKFEIENLKIIRLDDHINQLEIVSQRLGLDAEKICRTFMERLEKENYVYEAVKIAQSISLRPLIIDFYKLHKIDIPIPSDQLLKIIELVLSKDLFSALSIMVEGRKSFDELITEEVYREEQVKKFSEFIKRGVGFVRKLLKEKTIDIPGVSSVCWQVITNYITVVEALNIYYQENKIIILDTQELNELEDELSSYGVSDLLDMYKRAPQQENLEEEELAQKQKNPEPNSKKLKSGQFDKKNEKEEESEDENRNRPSF